MFFGKNMAERGNAVVVTIQYRLGPLGFLVHPGLDAESNNNVSGNYAVLDQIMALKWVRDNIAYFGADPNKVMIFGESAGGINVGNLLNTPLAARLFNRACIQSAVPMVDTYNNAQTKGIAFVDSFTVTGTDVQRIAYMRNLPGDSIVKYETPPISGGAVGLQWLPVIDGLAFSNTPNQNFQNGTFNKVPLIIGSNAEEMSLSTPSTVYPFMVTALIKSTVPAAYETQAKALYPPGTSAAEAKPSYIGLLTDAQFTASTRRTAQCVSQNQTDPVWRYFFTHKHSISSLEAMGSYHGMELFYVFNNWENATLGKGPLFSDADGIVQDAMLKYWVNFADTGNPNGAGLVAWPQYQSATDCYLEIKASPNGSQTGIRTAQCDLWDNVTGFTKCTSSVGIDETSSDITFGVGPNPTNGRILITPSRPTGAFTVALNDLGGRKIVSAHNATQADLTPFPAGIYLLTITQNGQIWKSKIVKH